MIICLSTSELISCIKGLLLAVFWYSNSNVWMQNKLLDRQGFTPEVFLLASREGVIPAGNGAKIAADIVGSTLWQIISLRLLRSVQISQEVDRRRRLDAISAERAAAIKEAYRPLHPHVYHLKVFTASLAACNVCDTYSPPVPRSPTSRQSSSRSSSTLGGRTPATRVSWTCWKKWQVSRKILLVSCRWRHQRLPTMLHTPASTHTHTQVKAVITFSCWPRPLPHRCLPHKLKGQPAEFLMGRCSFKVPEVWCKSDWLWNAASRIERRKPSQFFSDAHRYV